MILGCDDLQDSVEILGVETNAELFEAIIDDVAKIALRLRQQRCQEVDEDALSFQLLWVVRVAFLCFFRTGIGGNFLDS